MGWIFVVLAVILVHLAVVRWKEGKDKPIEFDTPILKARREKFKKSVKENIKDFFDPKNHDSSWPGSGD